MKQHMFDFPEPFPVLKTTKQIVFNVDLRTYTNIQLLNLIIGGGGAELLSLADNCLNELSKRNIYDLMKMKGIGRCKALSIMATFELGRRRQGELSREMLIVGQSSEVFEYFYPLLSDLPHEEFWLLFLRRNNSVIGSVRISVGGASGTVVDAKMVFRSALEHRACGLVLCHNHPSGSVKPSSHDVFLTRKLSEGGRNLDIYIGDHVIISGRNYYSFADDGLIYR